jgi:hypothetical protein
MYVRIRECILRAPPVRLALRGTAGYIRSRVFTRIPHLDNAGRIPERKSPTPIAAATRLADVTTPLDGSVS